MEEYFGSFWLVRLIFQRGLAGIYLVAFISALNQFPALLGASGLLPAYNPLHLVNTYGAFGSVTKERYEIVIEGTRDASVTEQTTWHDTSSRASREIQGEDRPR